MVKGGLTIGGKMRISIIDLLFYGVAISLWIVGLINIFSADFNSQALGLGFISIGFAVLSFYISIVAKYVAESSDEKMKSIATGNFYEITYRFWDRAPVLYDEQIKEVRDTQSWQLGNLFEHGDKLKKWAYPDVQVKLIKEFKTFLERLRPTRCKKYWVEVKNYMGVCKIAIDFKTENDDIKNELIDELGNWIGKKEGSCNPGYG